MNAALEVIRPGPLTTVQDLGRWGWQAYGVPPCGALDWFALRVANLLLGNPAGAAVLEMTMAGAKLKALAATQVAVTGARAAISLNREPRPAWSVINLAAGDVLNLGQAKRGARIYLALAGGMDLPPVMGSRSTYLGAVFGGHQGRPLAAGDLIAAGPVDRPAPPRALPPEFVPELGPSATLRALPGPQDEFFPRGLEVFFSSEYVVSPVSNRAGCRFTGPAVERDPGAPQSIISESNLAGGVQIPEDGQPIIVLREQTTSGYAKVASVITPDLDKVAQLRPGDKVRFSRVDLEQAHRIYAASRERLERIKKLISAQVG